MTNQNLSYASDRPKLQVIYYDGELQYIEQIVSSVSIQGDVAKAYRECTVGLTNTLDNLKRVVNIQNGKEVRILVGAKEIFRGIVFTNGRDSSGSESLTVHDYNVYLTKNTVRVKYVDKTATHIIKDLSKKFGIQVGNLANTKHQIPRFIMRGKTLYDVFITALTMTQKVTGKRYMLRSRKGKLELIEVRSASVWLRYEAGHNLISASYSESIEDVRTQIEYTGGDDNAPVKTVVKKDTAKYGIMQHTEHNSDANASALTPLAKSLLNELSKPSREMSIQVLGMPDMIAGTAIIAKDNLTGLSGGYFVTADKHDYSPSGSHVMDLSLSKTLDLPVLEYEAPDEETGSDIGKTAEYDVPYSTGWIATAYDPMLGGINTSGDPRTTATSTRWAYNRTIAVDPKVIPHGSVVAIRVPSMTQYNGLYLAEDSGGAIKGKRIDILIQGKSATSVFGRRNIEVAILEKGKGAPDARAKVKIWGSIKTKWNTKKEQGVIDKAAKGKAKDIIATANSYKGKLKYKFGGKNLSTGTGDCSGFTYTVFAKHGINIGHGTSVQSGKGKAVSKVDAKPGDLVFFQGTYRSGVSHVGIVTRKGFCVSLASSGCKEHSYTTGYWGQHFMSIRRVL